MVFDDKTGTLSPLPGVLARGLISVSIFGLLSCICSTSLFIYLTCRLVSWHRKSVVKMPINQFLFLIYNLLLADMQQAMAFLLNISALKNDAIEVGTSMCFAQGWFVSTGDLASSVFICAIAVHTFFAVVRNYRLPTVAFYCCIAGLWTFIYLLAIIGPAIHRNDFYARANAWCWINNAYQDERLWLHYFWVFVCLFSTVLIYATIFVYLRTRSGTRPNSLSNVHGAAPLMILYPIVYVVCTAPLAIGRIVELAGKHVSLRYYCVAGSMIASNGWLDAFLYTTTRADIVFAIHPPSEDVGLGTFGFMGKSHRFGTVTTVEAGNRGAKSLWGRRSQGEESVENLHGLGVIRIEGEVRVSVDGDVRGAVHRKSIETNNSGRTSGKDSHAWR